MKKKRFFRGCEYPGLMKLVVTMKLTTLLLFLSMVTMATGSYSQNTRFSLNVKDATILQVLEEIERQTEFGFLFKTDQLDMKDRYTVNLKEAKIENVMNEILDNEHYSYRVMDRIIVISKKDANPDDMTDQNNETVSGKVSDSSGVPLLGVTVVVKGTSNGTVTNADGEYFLNNIPDDAVLQYSFVGMRMQEVAVDGKSNIDVVMVADAIGLEEVVAIGYGTQKKINLTGAVSAVTGDKLTNRPVGQTSMALQGLAPGITVTQRSGQPGNDGGNIRIRGIGTLNDANPLVLVDGTEMNINHLDPNLIESVSVLKDAASSAIYGSRAANGVILITTKRAELDELSISYNHYSGLQTFTNLPERVGAIDHMTLLNEAYSNSGRTPVFSESYINEYQSNMASNPDEYPNVDWQNEVYKDFAYQQNHYLTIKGGTQKARLLAGVGFYKQDGLIPNTEYQRVSTRLNSDIQFSDKLNAKLDLNVIYNERREPGRGVNDVIYWVSRSPAIYPAKLTNGKWAVGWDGDNVLAFANDGGFRKYLSPTLSMNMGLNYKFTDNISADIVYSPSYNNVFSTVYNKSVLTYYPDGELAYTRPQKTFLNENRMWGLSHDFKAIGNFDRSWANAHNVKILAGFQWESGVNDYIGAYRDDFIFPQYSKLDAGGTDNQQNYGSGSEWSIASFFGRLNYDFQGKYLFEANLRYDGSSKFDTGYKWGLFPSFSLGWRFSEENFWESMKGTIENAKIRASWGKLGNQNIGNYAFASVVNSGSYIIGGNPVTSGYINDMANKAISWEETEMFNVGIDLMVLSKLNLTFDYYDKLTRGILWKLNVPHIIGLAPTYENAAEVSNKGWDLGITWSDRFNDFKYGASFMISDVKNEVLDLRGVNMTGLTVNREGYPINSLYGYEAIGYISPDDYDGDGNYKYATQFGNFGPGDIKYKNQNTDNVINNEDEVIIGSTIPRYTYSIDLNAGWRGIDFSMFWQGVGKADGLLHRQATMPFYWGATALEIHKDRWSIDNQDAQFPRMAFNEPNNEQNSSFWVKDASYLRLKNLTVGYTLPGSITNKIRLSRLRIYATGQNLLTFDNFWEGYDPEAPVGAGSYYPQVKVYTIGLDVTF
ncbi:TonB-dependent receptor [Maribellus sp. CM-23]|uniref:TonB-dependent receptor n=1 Tax=Maribellus sp. CM-23 TaxID=2781026 RepID=UPI001F2DD13D|nr:TonB-dependent receptor [Maribellus sp. CM-23]MCE4567042.1 TonB-dependent receptor [Maribellus sp. CM-23]